MPSPTYAASFDNLSSKKLGIRRHHVEQALREPWRADDISFVEGIFRVYARRVTETKIPHYLLILVRVEGAGLQVLYALRVFADLDPTLEERTPTEMLRLLAERFGKPFSVGGKATRFVECATVPYMDVANIVKGEFTKGQSSMVFFFFKYEKEPQPVAHVALGWHLDLDPYLAWVHQHE